MLVWYPWSADSKLKRYAKATVTIAKDGIAVIVNKDSKVDESNK